MKSMSVTTALKRHYMSSCMKLRPREQSHVADIPAKKPGLEEIPGHQPHILIADLHIRDCQLARRLETSGA